MDETIIQNKIGVNIVLLPSHEMTQVAIDINNSFSNTADENYVLNDETCIPHITLHMGVINSNDIHNVEKLLEEAASRYSVLDLEGIDIENYEIAKGKVISGLTIKKSPEILSLHQTVSKKIERYKLNTTATKDMFWSPPEIEDVSLEWVDGFGSNGEYSPHISLGIGRIKEFSSTTKFHAAEIALCHLGTYCTCRKILFSKRLKN